MLNKDTMWYKEIKDNVENHKPYTFKEFKEFINSLDIPDNTWVNMDIDTGDTTREVSIQGIRYVKFADGDFPVASLSIMNW